MLERVIIALIYAAVVGLVLFVVRLLAFFLIRKFEAGEPWYKVVDVVTAVLAVILILYLLLAVVSGRPFIP